MAIPSDVNTPQIDLNYSHEDTVLYIEVSQPNKLTMQMEYYEFHNEIC